VEEVVVMEAALTQGGTVMTLVLMITVALTAMQAMTLVAQMEAAEEHGGCTTEVEVLAEEVMIVIVFVVMEAVAAAEGTAIIIVAMTHVGLTAIQAMTAVARMEAEATGDMALVMVGLRPADLVLLP